MIFETHAHLQDDKFINDLDEVIKRAKNKNISKIINVGYNIETSKMAIDFAQKYEFMYAAVGIHPSEVENMRPGDLEELEELVKMDKVIAVGEIGLDYYWNKENAGKQAEMFAFQMKIAYNHKLPVIIHSRDAISETHDVLKNNNLVSGVMHCFSGSYDMAKKFINLNMKLGIGGVVTFKNANELKEVVKKVSLENLIVETDCPYLAPDPHRGKRNEPSYLNLIIDKISEIKRIPKEEVEKVTYKNSLELFKNA